MITVTLHTAIILFLVCATIVAVPAFNAVTVPSDMDATLLLLVIHIMESVAFDGVKYT